MDKKTKLTLDELVRRKAQMLEAKKKPKTEELYIKSLNGTITITAPSRATIIDAKGMGDDNESDAYFVLQIVTSPNLTELAKEYGCDDPMDIVDIIFEPGEVDAIAKCGLELAGYKDGMVKPVSGIKN